VEHKYSVERDLLMVLPPLILKVRKQGAYNVIGDNWFLAEKKSPQHTIKHPQVGFNVYY
jgi:hypothetical protein